MSHRHFIDSVKHEQFDQLSSVLEIGCATGALAEAITPGCYLGIDDNADNVSRARTRHPQHSFAVMALSELNLESHSVDAVVISVEIHRLDDLAMKAILVEAQRVLRPGGRLMLWTASPGANQLSLVARLTSWLLGGQQTRSEGLFKTLLTELFEETSTEPLDRGTCDYTVYLAKSQALPVAQEGTDESQREAHEAVVQGMGLLESGNFDQAIERFSYALHRYPDQADLNRLLGTAFAMNGDAHTALGFLESATRLDPALADAQLALGNVHRLLGQPEQALAPYGHLRDLQPDNLDVHREIGELNLELGDTAGACEALQRLLDIAPEANDYRLRLARLEIARKRYARGLEHLQILTKRLPESSEVHNELGMSQAMSGDPESAIVSFRLALALDATAHNNLGLALREVGQFSAAEASYRTALTLQPEFSVAHKNLGNLLNEQGRVAEGLEAYRRALALQPDDDATYSNLLLSLNYRDDMQPAEVFEEHCRWASSHTPSATDQTRFDSVERCTDKRLRIGYVSPDFRAHSVAFFSAPLLAAHDRTQFEVYAYADVDRPDDFTHRLRGLVDHWTDILGLNTEQVLESIVNDRTDILVDLSGHTRGNHLPVFARRAAPVQVTYLGYPNTTGLTTMDYRITDAWTELDGADVLYTEQLARLPSGFLCYEPAGQSPAVSPPPCIAAGAVTFGCFNNVNKISPSVITQWGEILRALPESRLLLKGRQFADADTQQRFLERLQREGVTLDRVVLEGWKRSLSEHLTCYSQVDIALDTTPYNGTTTTCEALWMGVPVLAVEGVTHAGRVSASILKRCGLAELVSADNEGLLRTAISLANDRRRLQTLRAGLRSRMQQSSLMNASEVCQALETQYLGMWERWCAGADRSSR